MKVKFSKFEKVAGLFVAIAIASSLFAFLGMAVKNGWFESRVEYQIELPTAEGLHDGTIVQIAGMRAGAVNGIELVNNSQVRIRFYVLQKFATKIKTDSAVQIFRPFVLGDRVLEVSVGEAPEALSAGSLLPVQASSDIMDFLSGKKMGVFLTSFEKLAESLRITSDAFADPKRIQGLVKTLDRIGPLVENLNEMSMGVAKITDAANREKRVETIIENLALLSEEMGHVVPEFNREVPNLGRQLGQIVNNLNILTAEFQKLTPAISAIAPDLPRTSRRAIEALDETVVLLKAMQKTWILKGTVEEVKEEERQPASDPNGKK